MNIASRLVISRLFDDPAFEAQNLKDNCNVRAGNTFLPLPLAELWIRKIWCRRVRSGAEESDFEKISFEANGRRIDSIGFGLGDRPLGSGSVDIAFQLRSEIWQGKTRHQLGLKDIRPSE